MGSPEEESNRFIREVLGLQGAAYLVIGLRYFYRIHSMGWKKLAWDNTLMFLATLVYTAESVMACLVVAYWKGLANNAMTDEQRAVIDPNSKEYQPGDFDLERGQKGIFVTYEEAATELQTQDRDLRRKGSRHTF